MKITISKRKIIGLILMAPLNLILIYIIFSGVLVDRMFILDIMAGIAMTSVTIGLILFNSERG